MSEQCACGHVRDEHESGFISKCTIDAEATADGEECRCICFDPEPEDEADAD